MDIDRTEALIARLKRDGWDITANAYKYQFPGVFVTVNADGTGHVLAAVGAPVLCLDRARRLTTYLSGLPGLKDVTMGSQMRGGDILIDFRHDGRSHWGAPIL